MREPDRLVPFDLRRIGAGLPVAGAVGALMDAVRGMGVAVVQAPPGTGKTTLVPPAVAEALGGAAGASGGRVVVTQPRRIAARAAARRLASLTGTRLGETVGYTVRGEARVSAATRVEFVTAGVLVRRLLADPDLPGVAAIVLDEVHERQIETDLAVAMAREVRELRDDLVVVAMSATLDAGRWSALLGDAPVVAVDADLHPLEVTWAPARGVRRLDDRGVTPAFLDHVAAATLDALAAHEGDGLVFLPGAREVAAVVGRLADAGVRALPLAGSLDARAQDAALADPGPAGPGPSASGRRVVVATAVAESSLTVPGVRIVVDAGLAREPRFDAGRGMTGLVTVAEARSSAVQRAGRAARQGPGLVVRCFPAEDWAGLRPFPTPEILTADLTSTALDLACWGTPGGEGLALPDAPPAPALGRAVATLVGLGALGPDGRTPTARGRALGRVPSDPRLARALLDASPAVGADRAAEIVALLSLDARVPSADLRDLWRALRRGVPETGRWQAETRRLARLARGAGVRTDAAPLADDEALGFTVALAFPDRIAHRRGGPDDPAYLLASGTGAALPPGSALLGQEWLAVADVTRADGRAAAGQGAVIRAAASLSGGLAREAGAGLLAEETAASFDAGRVTARRTTRLGAITLTSTPVAPTRAQARDAVASALARDGLGLVGFSDAAASLRRRLAFLRAHLGDPWPDVSDAALLASADEWLTPTLDALAAGRPRPVGADQLRALLPWPEASRLDELAPERVRVPSGSAIRVDYPDADGPDPDARPVVAVKLQECFGLSEAPRLAGGRVPVVLHLLSPARRPLAVTDDLASFWTNVYPAVRAENRGRYSKHPWPEDPWTAPARRGTTASGR